VRAPSKRRRFSAPDLWLLLLVLASAVAVVASVKWEEARGLASLEAKARASAELYGSSVERLLDKFRILPPLMAQRPDIVALFLDPDDEATRESAHLVAGKAAAMTGALQIRFLTPSAEVIATGHGPVSLYEAEGERFKDYFVAALEGRLGRGHSLIAPSRPVYHFAHVVKDGETIVGVIVVDVSLEEIEQSWRVSGEPLYITDEHGFVFLSSEASWRLMRVSPPVAPSASLPVRATGHPLVFSVKRDDGSVVDFIGVTRSIPILGWEMHVFGDLAPVRQNMLSVGAITAFTAASLIVLYVFFMRRKARAERQHRQDQAMALRLERRVRDRTRELTGANQALAAEVEERRIAEEKLRSAQDELVQTAKLAAIGQISAAMSHEFSQPLTAIRSYAENAVQFFKVGRSEEGSENLRRIYVLVERMAKLSKTLRTFARRASPEIGPVSLRLTLEEVSLLLAPTVQATGVDLEVDMRADIEVLGDPVRLTQILVNIVSNAIDAVRDRPVRLVRITAERRGDRALIKVRDTGPGIPREVEERIFEPFFTTKPAGEGVGLGLSIADKLTRDLNATIEFRNADDGGAEFSVLVPVADNDAVARSDRAYSLA
jgi:two-component system C4-dicarboxylate transport sensor histidine kinase DctB